MIGFSKNDEINIELKAFLKKLQSTFEKGTNACPSRISSSLDTSKST